MTFTLTDYIQTNRLAEALGDDEARIAVEELKRATGFEIYPRSIVAINNRLLFLIRVDNQKRLGIISLDKDNDDESQQFEGEEKSITLENKTASLKVCELSPKNAQALRASVAFLVARPLGLKKSAGCGDRLGLATPGHIRAIRKSDFAPILAQQSIRENSRTGRTPQIVMDDAVWGVFQEGWRAGFGADADHLKTKEDFEICAAAGYTFFTIDPSAHVDNRANTDDVETLQSKVAALDWNKLESSFEDVRARLTAKPINLASFEVQITEEQLLRAAAKYGRAIAHTIEMARHLKTVMNGRAYELEMSVDETETVTSLAEHIYIASELERLKIEVVSLAPRYVGDFEKGVDYIGDLDEFEKSFREHFAVAQTFGGYKLSLHSGSDKFSIYPVASRVAGELVHLKTAGTSYLEALRAVARLNPSLFQRIVRFACERYPTDRATYHVSAEVERMSDVEKLADDELKTLLDDFHAREILHVTFGSVLNNAEFRDEFFATLKANEEVYNDVVEAHFDKHFAPFGKSQKGQEGQEGQKGQAAVGD